MLNKVNNKGYDQFSQYNKVKVKLYLCLIN
jgi:hypothetical protein